MECIVSNIKILPKAIQSKFIKRVDQALKARTFTRLGFQEVSLSFVRDAAIRKLNREYRGKDKATDVLSFAHDGDDLVRSPSIGDIVISIDTAARQAKEFQVSLLDELSRLFIHGMLHCAGFDHENVSRAKAVKMFRTQSYLLARVRGSENETRKNLSRRR